MIASFFFILIMNSLIGQHYLEKKQSLPVEIIHSDIFSFFSALNANNFTFLISFYTDITGTHIHLLSQYNKAVV